MTTRNRTHTSPAVALTQSDVFDACCEWCGFTFMTDPDAEAVVFTCDQCGRASASRTRTPHSLHETRKYPKFDPRFQAPAKERRRLRTTPLVLVHDADAEAKKRAAATRGTGTRRGHQKFSLPEERERFDAKKA